MASVVGSEVEINNVTQMEIQEIEIEEIPVELSTETVISSDSVEEMTNMLSLPTIRDDTGMLIQTAEEIIDPMDHNLVYVDAIPHHSGGIEILHDGIHRRKTKRRHIRQKPYENVMNVPVDEYLPLGGSLKKWEQKQVQIKTLEGEFSVTMWASGKLFLNIYNNIKIL